MSSESKISAADLGKIIEATTREILKEMNTPVVPSMVSSSSKNNCPFDSYGPDMSDIETPALVSTMEDTIEIIRWCLAICQLGGDCCIVGHIYHEGSWKLYRTSYIRSVHGNGRFICDDDGNYFHIIGGLTPSTFDEFRQSESSAIQLNFLPETIDAFKNGIPPNYRMWVQRIACEAQMQSSFSRTYVHNESKSSHTNRGVRTENVGEDKAASIFGWERWLPQLSDTRHLSGLPPERNNEVNVDIDAEEESSEKESIDSGSSESEDEEEVDSNEDLPVDGETCESFVNRKLSGNPFKTNFYNKMLERTQILVTLRKKREARNQRKSISEKNLRNPRRKAEEFSDGQASMSSPNEKEPHHRRLPFPHENCQEIPSSDECKRRPVKSLLNAAKLQNHRQSFPDEKNQERSPKDTGQDSLVMFSSPGELSNNSSFREAWSVLNRVSSSGSDSDVISVSKREPKVRLEPVVCRQRLSSKKRCEAKRKRRPHSSHRRRKRLRLGSGSGSSASDFEELPRSAKRKKTNQKLPYSHSPKKKDPSRFHKKQTKADSEAPPRHEISFFGAPKATAANSPFVLHTLTGVRVDVRDLTRTRSGRLSCPPLDKWRGQRIATDNAGNITEVHHGQEDELYSLGIQHHSKSSSRRKKAARQKTASPAPHNIRVEAATARKKKKQKRQAVQK